MGLRRLLKFIGACVILAAPASAFAQPDPLGALVQQSAGQPAFQQQTVTTQGPPGAVQSQAGSPDQQAYILGPEDVVELEVLGRSDFKVRAKIENDGTILLPYLGAVQASNRTTQQLAAEVTRALEAGNYFTKPILRVDVVSFASRYVTVLGAVATPGLVPINRAYRLSEILARVGGVSPSSADYVIVRPEQGPEQRYSLKALTTGELSQDPFVSPGDKIFLPVAEIYYISGQVHSPGQYPVASEMTLRMAIARAGGLTDLGSDKRIKVHHKGQSKSTRLNLDDKVQAGDVIDVGERLF